MISKIVQDIDIALESGAYLSAMSLALTLPDICSSVAFPNEKSNKERYIKWYDENIGYLEKGPDNENNAPYLSGEVVYQLRCSFLHQGTLNIDKNKIKEERCQIDRFVLCIENKNDLDIYTDGATIMQEIDFREYHINVQRLCFIIKYFCNKYFEKNRDKFKKLNYPVIYTNNLNNLSQK